MLTAQPHTPPLVVKRKLTVKILRPLVKEKVSIALEKKMNELAADGHYFNRCFNFHFEKVLLSLDLQRRRQRGRVAEWPSGQRVGLAIRRSRVRVPLWPLAGFVLGRPEFKSSATLVNSQLVSSCQLGF